MLRKCLDLWNISAYLKHLGNCKVVALYTTEQVQTEENSLSRSLYYILFTLLYFLSRIFSRAVSLSLGHTLSLSGTVAHGLSRAHFRSLSTFASLLTSTAPHSALHPQKKTWRQTQRTMFAEIKMDAARVSVCLAIFKLMWNRSLNNEVILLSIYRLQLWL